MNYESFFEQIKEFREIQEKQKRTGLNDFNLLTTVRKYHDEVYLHSAMIGALLNPLGLHYQKTLFLELFLKEIGLSEWGLNLDNISVYVEYHDIDLYITDGVKHVIIENKIWAADQECQIIRYINIILQENFEAFKKIKENEIISEDLMRVVYLTAQSKKIPDEHTVKNGYISFCGGDKKLEKCSQKDRMKTLIKGGLKNYKAKYQRNTYIDVLKWLEKSKEQISNITNLNEAIQQYIDVVKMVNKTYEGNVMSLKEYIINNEVNFTLLKNIANEYQVMIQKTKDDFLSILENNLKNKYNECYRDNHIKLLIIDNIMLQTGIESNKVFITLYKKDWAKIVDEEKNIVLSKLSNIEKYKFIKPNWDGYVTIDIIDVESKEFLDINSSISIVLNLIDKIIKQLRI